MGWCLGMTSHEHALSLDQFFTRPALAKAIVEWADIQPGTRVLEPSCGAGDLVRWMPREAWVTALDIDADVFERWPPGVFREQQIVQDCVDFLQYRAASDAFDIAIMNPPYGYVGTGKQRQAADRLHVQHALRMTPDVIALVRANFLWGTERFQHVFYYAEIVRLAVLVHRPSFHGPAVAVDGKGGHHEMMVVHLRRRDPGQYGGRNIHRPSLEYWTQDWRIDP